MHLMLRPQVLFWVTAVLGGVAGVGGGEGLHSVN